MPRRAILDANGVLRYLLAYDSKQPPEAVELIEHAPDRNALSVGDHPGGGACTLKSHSGVPRDQISTAIQRVLAQWTLASAMRAPVAELRTGSLSPNWQDYTPVGVRRQSG